MGCWRDKKREEEDKIAGVLSFNTRANKTDA